MENDCYLKEIKMKVFYSFITILLLVSCNQNPVAKPDQVIDKETMTNILYDIAYLKAAQGYRYMDFENLDADKYIYNKYKIDSTTLAQNQKYYASNPTEFKKMYDDVLERIKIEEKIADSLAGQMKKEIKKPTLKKSLRPDLKINK